MILLEGPDRCGKSTVAQMLRTLLPGWSYRHHTKPPVPPYEYFSYFLADTHPMVVCDRNHWSGYAYGNAYLGTQKEMTDHEWRMIELAHLSRGTYVVLMTDDPDAILSRWSEDEMYQPTKIRELVGFYEELVTKRSGQVSYLPARAFRLPDLIRNDKPTDVLIEVAAHAQALALRAAHCLPASMGTGTFAPEFIVLGEAPGSCLTPTDRAPSMPWDKGPSSESLWTALDKIGLEWWRGYYTNQSAFQDHQHLARYVTQSLGSPKKILCLGKQARTMAYKALQHELLPGIEVCSVEHPAYIRRFHRHELDRWTVDLSKFLENFCGKGETSATA